MAVVKISELPAIDSVAGGDLLPIVDTSETETKKITKQQLLTDIDASELSISNMDEASAINDEDYLIINQNGESKKISKANARFASGDEVSIGTTQPVEDEKVWINPNESVNVYGSYISNAYGTSQTIGYSQEYMNNKTSWKLLGNLTNVGSSYYLDIPEDAKELFVKCCPVYNWDGTTTYILTDILSDTNSGFNSGFYKSSNDMIRVLIYATSSKIWMQEIVSNGSSRTSVQSCNIYYR